MPACSAGRRPWLCGWSPSCALARRPFLGCRSSNAVSLRRRCWSSVRADTSPWTSAARSSSKGCGCCTPTARFLVCGRPRFILAGDDPMQRLKAEGYLRWCHHITGKRFDCWDDLNASGELDDEGATFVALHFAFAEALEDAASAVRSMTADQVRAMLSVLFLGMIVELLSPEPVTKILFMVSMSNLIAFVGVDVFNNVVKGFISMLDA